MMTDSPTVSQLDGHRARRFTWNRSAPGCGASRRRVADRAVLHPRLRSAPGPGAPAHPRAERFTWNVPFGAAVVRLQCPPQGRSLPRIGGPFKDALSGALRRHRDRGRPRRHRGGARVGPDGAQDTAPHAQHRNSRPDVVQPLHRRHRQGPSGQGSGRAGRHDGHRHRRGGHPVQDAQFEQGAGGTRDACPGRSRSLQGRDSAPPRDRAEPDVVPAGRRRSADSRRPGDRRRHANRGRLRGRCGGSDHGHLPVGAGARRAANTTRPAVPGTRLPSGSAHVCGNSLCRSGGSRPGRRRVSTGGRSTSVRWRCSRATIRPRSFRSWATGRRIRGRSPAGSPIPTAERTRSSAAGSTARRFSPGSSRVSARATVRRSRTRSCVSRSATRTRSTWSRKAWTRPKIYPNGISTSLPFDVQLALVRSMKGCERAHLLRPGYSIEYDFYDPRAAQGHTRNEGDRRSLLRRTDQRYDGL